MCNHTVSNYILERQVSVYPQKLQQSVYTYTLYQLFNNCVFLSMSPMMPEEGVTLLPMLQEANSNLLLALRGSGMTKIAAAYDMAKDPAVMKMTDSELAQHDEDIFLFVHDYVNRNAQEICKALGLLPHQLGTAAPNQLALVKRYWGWKKGQTPIMSKSTRAYHRREAL